MLKIEFQYRRRGFFLPFAIYKNPTRNEILSYSLAELYLEMSSNNNNRKRQRQSETIFYCSVSTLFRIYEKQALKIEY
ncbi:CLUMA_CG020747, isoform A [Clunio marinus]|uniref:CLUMA_CG020747, isoform A n=1 Tax=Clunio marinus TaxID=568069 RepID=A0A1J1J9U6_9DIPT|nr:CLUMA_CG020747, isoform A [Clunio marinus]